MKITFDSDQFAAVMTACEIEGALHGVINPASTLVRAEIKTAEEVENDNRLFITYLREAHAFTLEELVKHFKYGGAGIGTWGKTRVVCFTKKK